MPPRRLAAAPTSTVLGTSVKRGEPGDLARSVASLIRAGQPPQAWAGLSLRAFASTKELRSAAARLSTSDMRADFPICAIRGGVRPDGAQTPGSDNCAVVQYMQRVAAAGIVARHSGQLFTGPGSGRSPARLIRWVKGVMMRK